MILEPAINSRVLLVSQTDPKDNGVYKVADSRGYKLEYLSERQLGAAKALKRSQTKKRNRAKSKAARTARKAQR